MTAGADDRLALRGSAWAAPMVLIAMAGLASCATNSGRLSSDDGGGGATDSAALDQGETDSRLADASDATTTDGSLDGASSLDTSAADGAPDSGQPPGPVTFKGFKGNHSSPTIVRVGSKYHVYFAQQNLGGKHYNTPYAVFTDTGGITFKGEALPKMGAAVKPGSRVTWAPGVERIKSDRWMLYYTSEREGTESQKCIFRARATGAAGPFVDDYNGPLYCAPRPQWAIDAYPFQDAQGNWYLGARIDVPNGINTIAIRRLASGGQYFATGSSWIELVRHVDSQTAWERPVIENAGIVRLKPAAGGTARWFVFYTGGAWDDNSYAIGYADCGTSIASGKCQKKTSSGPWLATDKAAKRFGPGTPTFYTDTAGNMMMSIQAWQYSGGKSNSKNKGQIMRTYRIELDALYRPKVQLTRIDLQP